MSKKGTHIFYHPLSLEHDTGTGHPERRARIEAVLGRLETSGLRDRCSWHQPEAAEFISVQANHGGDYIREVDSMAQSGGGAMDADTVISPQSYEAALHAAGACTQAVDAVLSEKATNAFCLNRPPGHHARPHQAMGFCLFNTIAIGARHAMLKHGLDRVFIFDWDVHHGNGTQESFYDDPSVFFCSIHQSPLYPGTGMPGETGRDEGIGYTLNLPVASGSTWSAYESLLKEEVIPAMQDFQPQLILISAGFDAHRRDPLAGVMLEDEDFRSMANLIFEVADNLCDGKVIAVLEGGYDLEGLAGGVEQLVRSMLARS